MATPTDADLRRNRLLGLLDADTRERLAPHLHEVPLVVRERIYEPNQPIQWAYFPVSGVISMVAEMGDTPAPLLEVATVGNEGMVGLPIFLGADLTPGFSFSQVAGSALRLSARALREFTADRGSLSRVLHRYTQALLIQIYQGTACNRVHNVQERCARWLLLTHDRTDQRQFVLSREFLGQMLGEPLTAVSLVSAMMVQAGFIRYEGDLVTILDRAGLESASCGCYRVVADEYQRMIQEPPAG